MNQPTSGATQPRMARAALVYLAYFVIAGVAAYLGRGMMVPGDGSASIRAVLSHTETYRAAFAVDLLSNMLYIALTALLYALFRPVDPTISLMAAFFSLVGCALQIFASVLQIEPLLLLTDASLSAAIGRAQLGTMALASFALYGQAFKAGLVCFGVYDALLGYLVLRSSYVPRWLGGLLLAAGIGWLTFAWPSRINVLSGVVLPLGALAEILLMVWLITRRASGADDHLQVRLAAQD